MTKIPPFSEFVKAHGHACIGIAIGYKIAACAAEWSGDDVNVKVYSNFERCPLDALKTLYGLREHPERLTVEDKKVLHFVLTKQDGSRMIIDEVPGSKIEPPEDEEEKAALIQKVLMMPDEELFTCRYE